MHEVIEGFIPVGEEDYHSEVARELFNALGADPADSSDDDYVLCRHPDGRWGLFEQGRAGRYAITGATEPVLRTQSGPLGRPQEMAIGPFVPGKWEEDER
jgi:hypothetical protein